MKFDYNSPVNIKNVALRYAILFEHKFMCVYCRDRLSLKTLELDHIISKDIHNKHKLSEYIALFDLPNNFNIDSVYNLAPSCAPCNNNKKEEPFEFGITSIVLRKISDKIDKVEKTYYKINESQQLDKAIALLSKSITDSEISIEEIYNTITNEEPEFEITENLNGNKYTLSSSKIYLNAFLPTITDPKGSCLFIFKSLKIRDCMITFNHDDIKNMLLCETDTDPVKTLRKFIIHEDQEKDTTLIQFCNNRFYLTKEETSDLCYKIDKLSEYYRKAEDEVISNYNLPQLYRSSRYADGFRILKIDRALWKSVIQFSHEFDVNKGDSTWHIFEAKLGHLTVYSKTDVDDFDAGYHTFLYPEEEEQLSAVSCLQDRDSIWIVWKPILYLEEKFSDRKLWDASFTYNWFVNMLIPKVIEHYNLNFKSVDLISKVTQLFAKMIS